MGVPGSGDNAPEHAVYVDEFWIMQTEVTNRQYGRCVKADVCTPPDRGPWEEATYADHPVVYVNWEQARAYAVWSGGRLPTEAEWEKAARGLEGYIYPWGNEMSGTLANHCDANCRYEHSNPDTDDGFAQSAPVGSYPLGASPYGALDMAGNVWEWVADWYSDSSYWRADSRNPTGPPDGDRKVVRGGSYVSRLDSIDGVTRYLYRVHFRNEVVGFRVVRSSIK